MTFWFPIMYKICGCVIIGMDMVMNGTVPKSAGLSSSSAIVCCSALATMHANQQTLTKVYIWDLFVNLCIVYW